MNVPFILKAVQVELVSIMKHIRNGDKPNDTYQKISKLTDQIGDIIKDSKKCP